MKKMLKVLGIILIVILVLVVLLVIKIVKDQKIQAEDQKAMIKSDEELIGEHLYINRDNKEELCYAFLSDILEQYNTLTDLQKNQYLVHYSYLQEMNQLEKALLITKKY